MTAEPLGGPEADDGGTSGGRSRWVGRLVLVVVLAPALLLAWSHLRSPASAVDLPARCGGFAWAGTETICSGVEVVHHHSWRTAKVRVRDGREWNRSHGTDLVASCPVYVTVRRTWLGWDAGDPWQGIDCVGAA